MTELAAIVPAVLLAALVQQATGFGFAVVLTPLLTLVMDAHDAVLLALTLGILGNLRLAIAERPHVARDTVAAVVAASVPGLAIGGWVYLNVSAQSLQMAVAVAVAGAVVALASGCTFRAGTRSAVVAAGLATGVLSTTTGTNGPPVVALLTARRVSPEEFRATASTVFLILDAVALAGLLLTRTLTGDQEGGLEGLVHPLHFAGAAVVLCGTLLVGARWGTRLRSHLDPVRFRRVVLVMLALTAVTAFSTAIS